MGSSWQTSGSSRLNVSQSVACWLLTAIAQSSFLSLAARFPAFVPPYLIPFSLPCLLLAFCPSFPLPLPSPAPSVYLSCRPPSLPAVFKACLPFPASVLGCLLLDATFAYPKIVTCTACTEARPSANTAPFTWPRQVVDFSLSQSTTVRISFAMLIAARMYAGYPRIPRPVNSFGWQALHLRLAMYLLLCLLCLASLLVQSQRKLPVPPIVAGGYSSWQWRRKYPRPGRRLTNPRYKWQGLRMETPVATQ